MKRRNADGETVMSRSDKFIIRWEPGDNAAFRAYFTDGVPLYMGSETEDDLRNRLSEFWPSAEIVRDDAAFRGTP